MQSIHLPDLQPRPRAVALLLLTLLLAGCAGRPLMPTPNLYIAGGSQPFAETPPALRLMGSVGERRDATEEEAAQWQNHIRLARGTKGYDLMWKDMAKVRDVYFDSFEPVLCGEMTQDLWT